MVTDPEKPAVDASEELVRLEVMAREADHELVRLLAKRLAEGGPEMDRLRAELQPLPKPPSRKGGIVRALLSSPLVGFELDLRRDYEWGREVDL